MSIGERWSENRSIGRSHGRSGGGSGGGGARAGGRRHRDLALANARQRTDNLIGGAGNQGGVEWASKENLALLVGGVGEGMVGGEGSNKRVVK